MIGQVLGPYQVLSKLGEGGMGEVYRARDTKLNRDVALKILPATVAADPDRVARFRREAQVLAALNHPHIAQIYGFEDSGSTHALVMELVDGPTLAERIAAGPIEIRDAIPLARQIADALEAAHEQGIVHRDLKPANVKVKDDGTVKVLDFGLAKALAPEGASTSADAMLSPTLTARSTQLGVILGTAAYMSPEQAKGKAIDKRTDVWAFGCVLYEMLTGRHAFGGEDVTDTIAAIVRGEPDWTLLPADVPDQIRLLLQKCLEKDRRARVSDIGVARFVLSETIPAGGRPVAATGTRRSRRWAALAAAGMGGAALLAGGLWFGARLNVLPAQAPMRFSIVLPASQPLAVDVAYPAVTVSPDGSKIVYRTGSVANTQIVVRDINELTTRVVGDTFSGQPALSPDGASLAYYFQGELRRVPTAGGPSTTISKLPAIPRGITWAGGDVLVFGSAEQGRGLYTVPAGGGTPRALTTPDPGAGEVFHLHPSMMPDGRSVLFTIGGATRPIEDGQIAVADLATGRYKTILRGGSSPAFVEPGYLVYATPGALRAVRFDPRRLEMIGSPLPVVDQVQTWPNGVANFSVSRNGLLVFVPGGATRTEGPPRSLVWVDRRGNETPINMPAKMYGAARLSPDETRVALDTRGDGGDIWVWDLAREILTPLNLDAGLDLAPVWTRDSRRIIWSSTRASVPPHLYWQSADGSGTVERLDGADLGAFPTSVTPDGSNVLLFNPNSGASNLYRLTLAPPHRLEPLVQSTAAKFGGEVSPDGQWLAYESSESGRPQILVTPFPDVNAPGRQQVSSDGGTRPLWSSDGRELFYLDANDLLTAVAVQMVPTFAAGKPARVLSTRYFPGATNRGYSLRSYDVSRDGKRFLMLKDPPAAPTPATPPSMTVVVNWPEELDARLPKR